MPNFISEDQIEKAAIELFKTRLGYDHIDCMYNDLSGRTSENEVVLIPRLKAALKKLNPGIPETAIQQAIDELCKQRRALSPVSANREAYQLIRDGVPVMVKDEKGREVPKTVRVIHFNEPTQNDFLVVSQLWIKGVINRRRPDLLVYVNGLPLVFIELKNSVQDVRLGFDDNLTNYRRDIPQLFIHNAVAILSNGLETRVGSFSAGWEHFGKWLKIEDEKEVAKKGKISLEYALLGICDKNHLLDYIENFILFYKETNKIIARNHQFIGVNNALKSFKERENKDGKLGVFWHTQGSGKSFSMIFFARKIFRKFTGNFTFLIVTDREDLNNQIYKNFRDSGAVNESENPKPANSEELRQMLMTNRRYIFTLIHKFRWQKGKPYPVLSERSDIIVIADEAHRTQYKDLAENLRKGLPNAQKIAFTATPLLGERRLTNDWFGDTISEYDFKQSCEDGATVPLYYDKRVPEVELINESLDQEFADIVQDENLSEKQETRLIEKYATELEVIRRPDRLERIAKDITEHFPRLGYRGKGIVVSVDKFTAVRMYELVKDNWQKEIRNLFKQISQTRNTSEKAELTDILNYMRSTDMAVVISSEENEVEKFEKAGLDIKPHRKRLNEVDENGQDIEDKFKAPNDPLRLVFVCAMWLTGFDVPTASVLYLDKPMKDHTLMQAIARVNRVAPGKQCGLIVDYYGVFRSLKKAFRDYAEESRKNREKEEGSDVDVGNMAEPKSRLYELLDAAIDEGVRFCLSLNINLQLIADSGETFENLNYFKEFTDIILSKDAYKKEFAVYQNTIAALYEACKPDIFKQAERKMVKIFQYLRRVVNRETDTGDMESAEKRLSGLLDESVGAGTPTVAEQIARWSKMEVIDLSKLDFGKVRKKFSQSSYKNIEVADLRAFIEKKLQPMINENINRINFAKRFQEIINEYNTGSMSVEAYFEELVKFSEGLREEEKRHLKENLTEEELELFDLLNKDGLTKNEAQEVKLAAKKLLQRLKDEKNRVLIQDWHKDTQSRLSVQSVMLDVLNKTLPHSYDRTIFNEKSNIVFEHFYNLAESGREFYLSAN